MVGKERTKLEVAGSNPRNTARVHIHMKNCVTFKNIFESCQPVVKGAPSLLVGNTNQQW